MAADREMISAHCIDDDQDDVRRRPAPIARTQRGKARESSAVHEGGDCHMVPVGGASEPDGVKARCSTNSASGSGGTITEVMAGGWRCGAGPVSIAFGVASGSIAVSGSYDLTRTNESIYPVQPVGRDITRWRLSELGNDRRDRRGALPYASHTGNGSFEDVHRYLRTTTGWTPHGPGGTRGRAKIVLGFVNLHPLKQLPA